jgi:HlyD family secretion protein
MKYITYSILLLLTLAFYSCNSNEKTSDAYGNFEASELIISSEVPGKIILFTVEEGQQLKNGQLVAVIDTILLSKQKDFINASIKAIQSKRQNANPEIEVIKEQKDHLLNEKIRLKKLFDGNAATQKQIDDLDAQIRVLDKKIIALKSKVKDVNNSISAQATPLRVQLEQIREKIIKSKVVNPIDGQVLSVFKKQGEVTGAGMPLYKIADLSTMELKAYISGAQIPHIKLNQNVTILIDEDKDSNKSIEGKITWISSKAEFTPKTIQTKDERVNQVYAIKVMVENDGSIKIGMPGEVVFGRE